MSYTVAVATTYRVGCQECIAEAERLCIEGLRDPTVTSLTLRATYNKCDHGEGRSAPAPASAALAGQLPLIPGLGTESASGQNGFDPPGRE